MTDELNLAHIFEPTRSAISQFAEELRSDLPDNLVALTIFGTALDEAFSAESDAIRTVVTLESIDLDFVKQLSHRAGTLAELGLAAPVIMTPEYVRQSLDALTLELLEIHQRHVTVLGDERLYADLVFEAEHIRLQCERDIKLQLRGMRQGLLLTAGRQEMLSALEVRAAESLMRTLRGLLWLHNEREFVDDWETIRLVEKAIGGDLAGVRFALSPAVEHGWEQFVALYQDLESLRDAVDNW